ARWPDELPGVGWEYGVAGEYLRDLADRWRHRFDWREAETRLNARPQFTTPVDGQDVHFLHVRSPRADATPLLLVHGWPSTPADFEPVIGPLTDPGDDDVPAFHVVAPSLPGFGFSGPTREPGWDTPRHARCLAELMARLGYDRYVVQGGDFGSMVGPEVGRVAAGHVLGVHLNALVTAAYPDWSSDDPLAGLSEAEQHAVHAAGAEWEQRAGYATIHSTRPQTIAYAMTDSPLGLLAWNLEWFVDYDPETTGQAPVDPDAYLTNVSTFWFTRTAGSSMRLYKEAGEAFTNPGPPSDVPTAVLSLLGDGAIRAFAEPTHRIVRWTTHDRGGHFASLQAPDLLVDDVRAFTAELLAGSYDR
ncbi:epoxide hydrolase family protein, partial [Pseudonocardia sp. KRD291]|uniref:epoxide hydrolase family protein n=1 Tax=Pseudonocardia sp. KRD291 TaxID=2792007 RepID=UPI001C49E9D4